MENQGNDALSNWRRELRRTLFYGTANVLLSGIKRMERHPAVLGAFLTWKEFLTENNLFNSKFRFLTVMAPKALVIDRGIDDRAWRAPVATVEDVPAAIEDAPESTDSAEDEEDNLFLWKPS